MVLVIPQVFLIYMPSDVALFDIIVTIGYQSLAIILSFLLLMYYFFDKLYIVLFFGCHQKKERSLKLFGKAFVLCSRCTGILIGVYGSILFYILLQDKIFYMFPLALWLVIDGLIQKKTDYVSTNLKRFLSGFFFAIPMVFLFGLFHYYYLQFFVFILELL
jgi:uncharacterized membrane protein